MYYCLQIFKAEETRAVRSQGEKNVNCMAMEIHKVGCVWILMED